MDLSFVGTAVWYVPGHEDTIACEPGQPLAAIVARVLDGDRCNLLVVDAEGRACTRTNVPFVDQDGPGPGDERSKPRSFFTQRPQPWVTAPKTGLTARVEKLEAGRGTADDTTCLADLAARLENVEARLTACAEDDPILARLAVLDARLDQIVADVLAVRPPTLGVESPAEAPVESPEDAEEPHKKRGKRH